MPPLLGPTPLKSAVPAVQQVSKTAALGFSPPKSVLLEYARSTAALARVDLFLVIDKLDLDTEFVNHPERYKQAGEEFVMAVSYRDASRRAAARVRSEVELQMRRDPQHKDDKEAHIKALVEASLKVVAADNEYAAWHTLAARWGNLTDSFDKRTKSLENLVKLFLAGYWTASSGGRTGRNEMGEEQAANVRREMAAGRAESGS